LKEAKKIHNEEADATIELDPATAKWIEDDAGRIAYSLLKYLEMAQYETNSPALKGRCDYGKVATAAKRLKPFSDATAQDWWNAAELVLFASYPRATLHTVPELAALVTAPSPLLTITEYLPESLVIAPETVNVAVSAPNV